MAIIECKYCGEKISDKAKRCVHCKENLIDEPEVTKKSKIDLEESDKVLVPVVCPNCSAQLNLDGSLKKAFCQYCGTQVLIKDTVSKVKIDKSEDIEKYRKLMLSAYKGNNNEECEKYATSILEIEPNDLEALYYKGTSIIWQGTLANPRIDELIVYYNDLINSLRKASKAERKKYKSEMYLEVLKATFALINLAIGDLNENTNDHETNNTSRIITEIRDSVVPFMTELILITDELEDYNYFEMIDTFAINKIQEVLNSEESIIKRYNARRSSDHTEYEAEKIITSSTSMLNIIVKLSMLISDVDHCTKATDAASMALIYMDGIKYSVYSVDLGYYIDRTPFRGRSTSPEGIKMATTAKTYIENALEIMNVYKRAYMRRMFEVYPSKIDEYLNPKQEEKEEMTKQLDEARTSLQFASQRLLELEQELKQTGMFKMKEKKDIKIKIDNFTRIKNQKLGEINELNKKIEEIDKFISMIDEIK